MTLLQLEEVCFDDVLLVPEADQIIKCGWCGEIFRLDGHDLALAMCQSCYDRMLAEYLHTQHAKQVATDAGR